MFKKIIRKLLALFNLQVSRIRVPAVRHDVPTPEIGKFAWLENYEIETVIDVGANIGQFTTEILKIFPKATVHCFEPLPEAYQELTHSFQGNSNVMAYNFGLGEANEEKEIFNNEYYPSSSLLEMMDLHKENFDYAVKVEPKLIAIRKLNDFFPEKIARPLLIKIDVQGYEMYVLKGGEAVIVQADIIIIETSFYPLYKGQPLFDEIYAYFVAKGFQYAGNTEELLSPLDNRVLQADAIFVHKSFAAAQNKHNS